jgi:hypothetical protein
MATINAIANKSGTLTVDSALTVSAGGAAITGASTINGGTVGIGTTATDSQIDIGTGANAGRTVNVGSATAASVTLIDCGTGGISVGINTAHTSTFGSANGASASTLQAGSGALNVTSANGAMTLNSGNGTISMSTDGANTTMNIGTGAGAKLVTLGSTNGASSLGLRFGTADFSLASATGNIVVAQDTGEINYPLQPAFLAELAAARNDVTGDGTVYKVDWGTEIFDQNADWDNVSTFTAPVTGRYQFNLGILLNDVGAAHTVFNMLIVTHNRQYIMNASNPYAISVGGQQSQSFSVLTDMDAADTAYVNIVVSGSTKTVDIVTGGATDPRCYFSGFLAC